MENTKKLRNTAWLSQRLGLSVTTIERMRTCTPELLPSHLKLGRSVRYDEQLVENWILSQMGLQSGQSSRNEASGVNNV